MKQLLLVIVIQLFSSSAHCCSCVGEPDFKAEFKRSDVVITGKVIHQEIIKLTDTLIPFERYQTVYTFRITRNYKGNVKDTLVKIFTGVGSGDCGFLFSMGNEYIIYCSYEEKYYAQGNPVSPFLYTDRCRRTRLADDAEELKHLNKSKNIHKYSKLCTD